MAVSSLGLGIHITVTGGFEPKLDSANRKVRGLSGNVNNLAKSQARATSIALKQAAAFGILSVGAGRLAQKFNAMSKSLIGAFSRILNAGGELQSSMAALRVFFGTDTETIAGAVLNIANSTDIALPRVIDVARRFGSLGLAAEQSTRGIRVVTQAITTLSGQARTRAIQGVANMFDNLNSAARLLDTSFTELEKSQIKSLKGSERTTKIIELLEKRFGNVSKVMSKTFLFRLRQLGQLFELAFAKIAQPALEALTPPLIRVVDKFNKLVESAEAQEKIFKPLGAVFKALISPFIRFFEILDKYDVIPKTLQFLADNRTLVQFAAISAVVGTTLAGAFLTLAATVGAATASILLFKSVALPAIMGTAGAAPAMAGAGAGLAATPITDPSRLLGPAPKMIAAKARAIMGLKTVLTGFGKALLAVSKFGLVLVGALISLAALVGTLAGAFSAAKAPAIDFIKDMVKGFGMAIRGMMEVLKTGSIAEDLFISLNESGFGPIFRGLTWIALRLQDIFNISYAIASTLGPDFRQTFDIVKFAITDIAEALVRMLETLGIISPEAVKTGEALGFVFGGALVGAIKLVLTLIEGVSLALTTLVRGIAGLIEMLDGLVKVVLGSITKLSSSKAFQGLLLLTPGGAGIVASLNAGRKAAGMSREQAGIVGGEMLSEGMESFKRGWGTWTGAGSAGMGTPQDTTINLQNNNSTSVQMNGREMGRAMNKSQKQVQAAGNAGGVPAAKTGT